MSGEKLLASYVVRVKVRNGRTVIAVLDMSRGVITRLDSYQALTRHLELAEADEFQPDTPPRGGNGGRK